MSVIKRVENNYVFNCPGCKHPHSIDNGWEFNGDLDYPTFSPSILVRSGCYAPHHTQGEHCWCTYNRNRVESGEEPSQFNCVVCHSYITNGEIYFLSDSTHELSGRTVRLPNMENCR